jgi:hypothetical protein
MKNKGKSHKTTAHKAHNLKIGNNNQHAQEGQAPQAPNAGTSAQNQYR